MLEQYINLLYQKEIYRIISLYFSEIVAVKISHLGTKYEKRKSPVWWRPHYSKFCITENRMYEINLIVNKTYSKNMRRNIYHYHAFQSTNFFSEKFLPKLIPLNYFSYSFLYDNSFLAQLSAQGSGA